MELHAATDCSLLNPPHPKDNTPKTDMSSVLLPWSAARQAHMCTWQVKSEEVSAAALSSLKAEVAHDSALHLAKVTSDRLSQFW